MQRDYQNNNEKRNRRNRYIEWKYPELKDLTKEQNAKYYVSFMEEYYYLKEHQYKRVLSSERVEEYKNLKKRLDFLCSHDLIKLEIKKRKTGDIGVSIVFEMIVQSSNTQDLVGRLIGEIMYTYDEYLLQVIENEKMRLSFDVKLSEKIFAECFEDELKELEMKMKYLLGQK